jgi:endonuclease G
MKRILWLFFLFPLLIYAQNDPKVVLQQLESDLVSLKKQQETVLAKIESTKLVMLRTDLEANGLPQVKEGEKLIKHSAMYLVYSEEHEQAAWVAHVILPDVLTGKVSRTNDFRTDPLVLSGSTDEEDFFLTTTQEDGSKDYDGFGFDRGHLAPSADFRWSQTALSESYFYSNMSPQRPDFNRGIWAEVEGKIRGYLNNYPTVQLYVVTGPVLKPGLPVVERSINKPSIPEQYFKVVMDLDNQRGIAFLLKNEKALDPVSSYAVTIDQIEELTGIDFYHDVPDVIEEGLESSLDLEKWLPKGSEGDVKALDPTELPKNNFNTKQAELYKGRNDNVTICGTVVGARTSRAGNVLLNLDKQYPNQVFTVFIRKEDLGNFSYNPEEAWKDQIIAVTGKVAAMGSTPAIYVKHEKEIKAFEGKR